MCVCVCSIINSDKWLRLNNDIKYNRRSNPPWLLAKKQLYSWKALKSLFKLNEHDPYWFSDIDSAASLQQQERLKFRGVIQPFQLVMKRPIQLGDKGSLPVTLVFSLGVATKAPMNCWTIALESWLWNPRVW